MGIAAHHPFGLLVAASYLLVAALAAIVARRSFRVRRSGRTADRARARAVAWSVTTAVLLGLVLARICQLEGAITDHFRRAAIDGGAYDDRRHAQIIGVVVVLVVAIVIVAGALGLLRRAGGAALIAMTAAMLLAMFVGVRTISFHEIDGLLAIAVRGFNVSNAVELGGLVVIAVAARRRPSSSWISRTAHSHRGAKRSR